eukprot:4237588-Pleurochrysis_carterae.AAC.2
MYTIATFSPIAQYVLLRRFEDHKLSSFMRTTCKNSSRLLKRQELHHRGASSPSSPDQCALKAACHSGTIENEDPDPTLWNRSASVPDSRNLSCPVAASALLSEGPPDSCLAGWISPSLSNSPTARSKSARCTPESVSTADASTPAAPADCSTLASAYSACITNSSNSACWSCCDNKNSKAQAATRALSAHEARSKYSPASSSLATSRCCRNWLRKAS